MFAIGLQTRGVFPFPERYDEPGGHRFVHGVLDALAAGGICVCGW
ncbi:hypothetical protein [Streptomyces sp. NPDC050485]